MKLRQLIAGLEPLACHAELDCEITGVCYDSRCIEPGNLFVAVSGFAVDGHRFIPQAQQKGAQVVVCERPPERGQYLLVRSSREALALLSANWFDHPAKKMTMIGVTGTNGKTTVTTLLKQVLQSLTGEKAGLIGTVQNEIGDEVLPTERTTPESYELQKLLAQMHQAGCAYVAMEVSSHAIALSRVAQIDYAVGVFTNLTEDHLDFHKTMEHYARTKAELFDRCRVGVINSDDGWAGTMTQNATCRFFTVSAAKPADLRAENVRLYTGSVCFDACLSDERCPVSVPIPGNFTVYNALSVIGAALQLGLPLQQIAAALGQIKSVAGRVEPVPTPGVGYTVLIDYAHTPDALENVLKSVRASCKGRLIAVFGCGGDRDPMKRPLMGGIGVAYADLAVITSDNPRTEQPAAIIQDILAGVPAAKENYVVIEDRRTAIEWAMDNARTDDVIVLAGKGHETYQIVGTQKRHLDEREIVADYLCRQ